MLKNNKVLLIALMLVTVSSMTAFAHFQEILPNINIISNTTGANLILSLLFTHPMEDGPVMEMKKPVRFGVQVGDKKTDLLDTLKNKKISGKNTWLSPYTVKRPGDYIFYVEPAPYWEPSEEKMIIHYSKVVVSAFGEESGWDEMVGFPIEIKPLVRPYGLWTGNLFRGIVIKNGKPLPFAEIEVEYVNKGRKVSIPSDPYITQVIKADRNGVFLYAMPKGGWWGFAALVDGDNKMKNPEGKMVDVELGGLMWVSCMDMQEVNSEQ
ncbi:MAG: DUF4198 domain-containing protein [Planctomycetota bacterium]|jgi:cobalt/nickel transport protein